MEKGYYTAVSGTYERVTSPMRILELFRDGSLLYFDGHRLSSVDYLDAYNLEQ
jgi:hypothetical protein